MAERGTGGEAKGHKRKGPLPLEAGPRSSRECRLSDQAHPLPAVTAPQPRPLPEERAHIFRQGGQQRVAVGRAIMARYLPRGSWRVIPSIGWLTRVSPPVNYRSWGAPVRTTGTITTTRSMGGSRRRTQGNG